ncbi:MAG: protein adenylyltransferase SelO family protein, partial [Candidatus Marinamargulisbacteria bacterium]|nr:protein adenylyltransferase SelO family protein [Candidatus Marinamargulisbacteria bacterium]
LADQLGLGHWEQRPDILSGNTVPEGAAPIALGYAGHQFGHWVPQLGDGRAVLLGHVQHQNGHWVDIQLKGSGRTRYSRQGDGRCPLGAALREYIISEALHARNIPTTRTLAVVRTGETVYRDTPQPGGIVVRVARSHIRVGSFEYWATHWPDTFESIAHGAIRHLVPDCADSDTPFIDFFNHVCGQQGALIAQWMAAGFVHGVMNTDNMSLSGETIDFGPCAFRDTDYPNPVFSRIDQYGRYAYDQQYRIGEWNLTQLGHRLCDATPNLDRNALLRTGLTHYHANYNRMTHRLADQPPAEHPRNHWVEAAINQAVEHDNWAFLHALNVQLSTPNTHNQNFEKQAQSIPKIDDYYTVCGT